MSLTPVAAPILKPFGLASASWNPGASGLKVDPVVPPALKWKVSQFFRLRLEQVPGVQVERLAVFGQSAFQLQRCEVEIFLIVRAAADTQRERPAPRPSGRGKGGAWLCGSASEVRVGRSRRLRSRGGAHRHCPTQAARMDWDSVPLVLKSTPSLGSLAELSSWPAPARFARCGARTLFGWIELVRVDEDQPEPAHQVRILESSLMRDWSRPRREDRRVAIVEIMRRINREVVALHVTRPACPAVAIELLVEEEPAALRDKRREACRAGRRGRGDRTRVLNAGSSANRT